MPEDKTLQLQPEIKSELNIEKISEDKEKIVLPEKEKMESIEDVLEMPAEQKEEKQLEKMGEGRSGGELLGVSGVMPASVLQRHKEREKEIESILAQDLEDFYLSMGEEKRMEFKIVGEKTARIINTMIETGKFQAKKIIELIRKWLSIVPGINKFFVEQQAKIKTDRIMRIKK